MGFVVDIDDKESLLKLERLVIPHNNSGRITTQFYGGSGHRSSSIHKTPPGRFPYQIICGKCNGFCNTKPNTGYINLVVCALCGIRYCERQNNLQSV